MNSISARLGPENRASTVNIKGVTTVTAESGQESYFCGIYALVGDGYSGGGEYKCIRCY